MQNLAADVGSLKQVLSGVKTRGILGEVQLGAILKEILAPGQYAENVATVPGSSNRVEYAVKLPGQSGTVWLPIDAKFPGDTYAHLQDAQASGDPAAVAAARRQLETVVRQEAKDIHDKYIEVPYTTAFGILFLPFEGLYAEVVNCGLPEIFAAGLQDQHCGAFHYGGPAECAADGLPHAGHPKALRRGMADFGRGKDGVREVRQWTAIHAAPPEPDRQRSGRVDRRPQPRYYPASWKACSSWNPPKPPIFLGLAEGGSRISAQNSEIDRQDNAPRLRRKDDAGMPM